MIKRISALIAGAAIAASAFGQSPSTEGEVRKVDKSTGKITLRHGEIKNLDMPPMTMVFTAKDPALLEKVKAGDKVLFHAEKDGPTYLVTAIEAKK